ncbi:MAG: hypothetical protein ACTSQE_07915 [Candidatus Heimdallarchaeaceae archaeon]
MADILDFEEVDINITIEKMGAIISLYEKGTVSKKEAARLASKLLRLFKKYTPEKEQQETYDFVLDLCISLTTIKRAEGQFESLYLKSLKEELEKAKNM